MQNIRIMAIMSKVPPPISCYVMTDQPAKIFQTEEIILTAMQPTFILQTEEIILMAIQSTYIL